MDKISAEELKQLVLKARKNDDVAFSTLCKIYEGMLHKSVSAFEDRIDLPREDIYQEALLAFSRAAYKYDLENNEVTFGLFSKICVKNALVSHSRRRRTVTVCSLDELFEHGDIGDPEAGDGPEHRLIGIEEAAKLRERIRAILSDFEYAVFLCYVDGLDTAEIAAVLARPQKSVQNALYRLFTKLRLSLR